MLWGTATLQSHGRWLTIEELTEAGYPDEAVTDKHVSSVRRALKNLPGLKIRRQREGEYGARGWRYQCPPILDVADMCCVLQVTGIGSSSAPSGTRIQPIAPFASD
jgi:hypothetical protein